LLAHLSERPSERVGGPRHLAVADLEQGDAETLAHRSARASNLVVPGETSDDNDETAEYDDVLRTAAGIRL
jgi:hypothetical protein